MIERSTDQALKRWAKYATAEPGAGTPGLGSRKLVAPAFSVTDALLSRYVWKLGDIEGAQGLGVPIGSYGFSLRLGRAIGDELLIDLGQPNHPQEKRPRRKNWARGSPAAASRAEGPTRKP